MAKQPLIIAGNWKMNPQTQADAKRLFSVYKKLAKKYPKNHFVAAVPPVYLYQLQTPALPINLVLSAENIYLHEGGSYTGAVSVPMVRDAGAGMTLIGHSERRSLFAVTNELISQKIEQCIKHKMPMIVCFGEENRDNSGDYTEELEMQLQHIIKPFIESKSLKLLHLAYEPVWAIGSNAKRPITNDELFSTILLIKKILIAELGETRAKKIPILYGGSVNGENAQALAQVPGVGGFLIGRASLSAESLTEIVKAVN